MPCVEVRQVSKREDSLEKNCVIVSDSQGQSNQAGGHHLIDS